MGHQEKTSTTAFIVPFLLVLLAAACLILVSDLNKPKNSKPAPTEQHAK